MINEEMENANLVQTKEESANVNRYYDNLSKYYNSVDYCLGVSFEDFCKKNNL